MGYILIILSVFFYLAALAGFKITGMKKLFIGVYSLHVLSVLAAFGIVLRAFIRSDFSFAYVQSSSSADLPLYYKIAALWSGHEGSLLMWIAMISLVSFLYFAVEKEVSLFETVVHFINFLFLASILLFYSNPFVMTGGTPPAEGAGLNPLLMNFWMTVHPPFTFLGYTFAIIGFSSSIRRMLKEEYFYDHDQKIPVVLVLLTLGTGLVFGGIWAYRTLGWGGFWGWDPVENASLIPWLLALVYIHSSLLEKRYRQLIVHNNLTSAFIYITVVIAVFLTRSGVLAESSVHSFGRSGIELPFIVYIIFLVFMVLFIAVRYNKFKPSVIQDDYDFISHLSYAIIAIGIFNFFIFSATILPVISGYFGKPIAVDSALYPRVASIFAAAYIMSVFNYYYDNRSEDRMVLVASGILAMSTAVYFSMLSFYQFLIVYFSFMMFFYLVYKLVFHNRGSENKTALCSHIIVMMFITAAILMNLQEPATYDLAPGEMFDTAEGQVEFTGYNEKSENIMFKLGDKRMLVPYSVRGNSIVSSPLIISQKLSDVYVEPVRIISSMDRATLFTVTSKDFLQWREGDFVRLDDLSIRKNADSVNVEAVLEFKNGGLSEKTAVALNFSGDSMAETASENPFTGQKVRLRKFSADEKIVQIYIAPDIYTKYKSDTLEVNVSRKLFIRVIWAAFGILMVLFFFLLIKTFTSYELY